MTSSCERSTHGLESRQAALRSKGRRLGEERRTHEFGCVGHQVRRLLEPLEDAEDEVLQCTKSSKPSGRARGTPIDEVDRRERLRGSRRTCS